MQSIAKLTVLTEPEKVYIAVCVRLDGTIVRGSKFYTRHGDALNYCDKFNRYGSKYGTYKVMKLTITTGELI